MLRRFIFIIMGVFILAIVLPFPAPAASFQRVGVRLVDLVAQVLFVDPPAASIDAEARIPRWNLPEGHQDFHRDAPGKLALAI